MDGGRRYNSPFEGVFVYYEKNNEMQNYMLSRNADQSEDVSDQAALNFRKIMKEKQDIKHPQKSKHINQTPKLTAENGIWVKAGVAIHFYYFSRRWCPFFKRDE